MAASRSAASLNQPYEVRFDPTGNLYFVEMQNHVVRRVDAHTHIITTVAGTGAARIQRRWRPGDTEAQFRQPHSIAFAPDGSLLDLRHRQSPHPARGSGNRA